MAPPVTGRQKGLGERAKDFLVGRSAEQISAQQIAAQEAATGFGRLDFYGQLQEALATGRGIAGQQQTLADLLAQRARGEGQSVAEMQLQRTLDANQRRAAGAIRSTRGLNPALARRLLLNQQARMQQEAAGQGAILRAQEQVAAQQALGQQLSGMRGAEQALYGQSGELGFGQEKLGVSTEEARRQRDLDTARANQQADLERQRLQIEENKAAAGDKGLVGEIGEAATEAGKAFARAKAGGAGGFDGGSVNKGSIGMAKSKKMADGGLSALDNEKNDTIPAMLSAGELVVPRSIMAHEDAPVKAAAFIKAIMERKSPKEAKKEAFSRPSFRQIKELEKRINEMSK